MAAFAVASLLPVPLLAFGIWAGGGWVWAGFLYVTVLAALLDQMLPLALGDAPEGAEFPAADAALVAVSVSALALLPAATWAIAGSSDLRPGQKLLIFLGTALWLGQVGHPAAHELIHRGNRTLFRLGQAVYAALLFGQHASAHRLVHHRHVGTAQDPNSARSGEGFYRFAPRAWRGSFIKGLSAETALRAKGKGGGGPHPYIVYIFIGTVGLTLATWIGGVWGALTWLGLALHAQMQILLSDYVQHYGLRRVILADGRPEPVGPQHSWNTAQWFSAAMMLNAPRHSDHHAHPARPYPALRLAADAPRLPWPLPVACTLALMPRLWRRSMAPRLKPWAKASEARQVTQA